SSEQTVMRIDPPATSSLFDPPDFWLPLPKPGSDQSQQRVPPTASPLPRIAPSRSPHRAQVCRLDLLGETRYVSGTLAPISGCWRHPTGFASRASIESQSSPHSSARPQNEACH